MDARGTERPFHRYRQAQADVAVVRAGIYIRLQIARNLHVHASITGRSAENALLIPVEALQTAPDNSKFVMVVGSDGAAHKHPVTIGLQAKTEVQVLSGLTPTDQVISTGSFGLDEGTKVKVGAAKDADAGDKPAAGKGGDDK